MIFAGADSVLKTTPLFILGLIVSNPVVAVATAADTIAAARSTT
jgi:hypothetical protein